MIKYILPLSILCCQMYAGPSRQNGIADKTSSSRIEEYQKESLPDSSVGPINQQKYNEEVFAQNLKECLVNHSGYDVITVSRRYIQDDNAVVSCENLDDIIRQISEGARDTLRPCIIVFNEYFFKRSTLEFSEFKQLIEKLKSISKENKYCICYANFLYKMSDDANSEYGIGKNYSKVVEYLNPFGTKPCNLDDIIKYGLLREYICSMISNDGSIDDKLKDEYINILKQTISIPDKTWPNVGRNVNTATEYKNGYFANETFVIHNDQIISRYKKNSYADEDEKMQAKCNYCYGLGVNEKKENNRVADVVHKYVYNDICLDIDSCNRFFALYNKDNEF